MKTKLFEASVVLLLALAIFVMLEAAVLLGFIIIDLIFNVGG